MDPALIIAAINGGIQLIDLGMKAAEHFKQSAEATPEQEAALDAKIAELKKKPWWQPEAE